MIIYTSKLNIYFKTQALKMNILIQTQYFMDRDYLVSVYKLRVWFRKFEFEPACLPACLQRQGLQIEIISNFIYVKCGRVISLRPSVELPDLSRHLF